MEIDKLAVNSWKPSALDFAAQDDHERQVYPQQNDCGFKPYHYA